METKNAIIKSTQLGIEDHGIFTITSLAPSLIMRGVEGEKTVKEWNIL